jgi:hypothetical protein
MKNIYLKAIEMLQPTLIKCTGTDGVEREIKLSHANFRIEHEGFEFVFNESGESYDRFVKVIKKDIGFTFKVIKNDPEDLNRMQYVYDVTVAAKNDQLLLPFAKKVMPDWKKIDKKFPGKVSKSEYDSLDIHDKNAVVNFLNKLTA